MKKYLVIALALVSAPFVALAVQPNHNIDVTSPADGNVWQVGVTQNIRWVAPEDVDVVDITLFHYDCELDMSDCDQVESIILADDVPNNGLFDIQPRPGYATSSRDKYKVEIRHHQYNGTSDGYFTITNPNNITMARGVTLLTPNTNTDTWTVGQTRMIKWRTAAPGGVVDVAIRDTRNGNEKNIATNMPNTGKLFYTLPAHLGNLGTLEGQYYKIVVTHGRPGPDPVDTSDGTFTVNVAP